MSGLCCIERVRAMEGVTLISLITVLDSSTAARQRLYLFAPTCLCIGLQNWVQHRTDCVLYV